MTHWNPQTVLTDNAAPTDIVNIALLVMDQINSDPHLYPRVVSFGAFDEDDDAIHRYEVVTELAPGVILPAGYGLAFGLQEEWEEPRDDDAEMAAAAVAEAVRACLPHIDRLSDILHDVRRRARRVINQWQNESLRSRLVEVRLAPYDRWRSRPIPRILVLVEGLDDRLMPHINEVHVDDPESLEADLAVHWEICADRSSKLSEVASKGASGTIDQLALNAISHHGDTAETLRQFGSHWRFWLPDSTTILVRDGHVRALHGVGGDRIEWSSGSITIHDLFLPEIELSAAVDRPVTSIIQHPFLSDDMLVRSGSCSIEHGRPSVTIEFDVLHKLFCSVTGRVWDDVAVSSASSGAIDA